MKYLCIVLLFFTTLAGTALAAPGPCQKKNTDCLILSCPSPKIGGVSVDEAWRCKSACDKNFKDCLAKEAAQKKAGPQEPPPKEAARAE